MVCNISGPNWFEALRRDVVVGACPEKCFAIHDGDVAMPLLHGIYTSAIKPMQRFRRIRGGAYNLFPKATRNPVLEDCDGKAFNHKKTKLACFWGQNSSSVRRNLFLAGNDPEIEIFDTTGRFTAFAGVVGLANEYHSKYVESLLRSKFAICPRGVSPSSIRLFEAMRMGVCPVIVSDACLLPSGPDWSAFALFLEESRVGELRPFLRHHEKSFASMGELARAAYEEHFDDAVYFNYLVDQMAAIRSSQAIPERIFWALRNIQVKIYEKQEVPLKNWKCLRCA